MISQIVEERDSEQSDSVVTTTNSPKPRHTYPQHPPLMTMKTLIRPSTKNHRRHSDKQSDTSMVSRAGSKRHNESGLQKLGTFIKQRGSKVTLTQDDSQTKFINNLCEQYFQANDAFDSPTKQPSASQQTLVNQRKKLQKVFEGSKKHELMLRSEFRAAMSGCNAE